jgi:hypothetical protein
MRCQQRGRRVSRVASRQRAVILSDIINESLKLLQINCLEKWTFSLIFLQSHTVLVTEHMARLGMYDLMCYNLRMHWCVKRWIFLLNAYYSHHKQKGAQHYVCVDVLSDCTVDWMPNYLLLLHMDVTLYVCVDAL